MITPEDNIYNIYTDNICIYVFLWMNILYICRKNEAEQKGESKKKKENFTKDLIAKIERAHWVRQNERRNMTEHIL